MRYQYVHFQLLGKLAQILLDDVMPAVVGATSVTQEQHGLGLGVLPLEVFTPKVPDVVANELARVVAFPKAQVALVLRHVINAMRDDLPFCVALEVVVVDLAWLGAVG